MSARTFARRFVDETGRTPMQWVTDQRVLYARRLLEETDLDIDRVEGKVRAKGTELHGTVVAGSQVPDLIDEVPALAIAAAFAASGSLRFEDAAELRTKESDRIDTVAAMITALGGSAATGHDFIEISAQRLHAGHVASHHDHRIAMAAAITSSGMTETEVVEIDDWSCVATSYPAFLADLNVLTE